MKNLQKLFLVMVAVSVAANARSIRPIEQPEVAPVLAQLEVSNVAPEGTGVILRARHRHPFSNFLIGIPASILTGSACTGFAGQETTVKGKLLSIRAVGASNPLTEACIAVMPMPISTNLTFEMNILTGGFVPAQPIQRQLVQIAGVGRFVVTLDMAHDLVTVQPLRLPLS